MRAWPFQEELFNFSVVSRFSFGVSKIIYFVKGLERVDPSIRLNYTASTVSMPEIDINFS